MSVRNAVVAGVGLLLATAFVVMTGVVCYRLGYEKGRHDGSVFVQEEDWKGASYEKSIGDLGSSVRSLEAIVRNPEAFTPAEREYWRDLARFSITVLEGGFLARLEQGEQVMAYGEPLRAAPVRRLLERAKALLEKVPA